MSEKNITPINDDVNADAVKKELETDLSEVDYRHHFSKPFEWMGKTYETLDFNFTQLTGKTSLSIYSELQSKGIIIMSPRTSPHYQMILASKACGLGADAFEAMPYRDFETILAKTRNFIPSAALI